MMCALRRSSVKRAFCRRSFWASSSMGLRLDFGPRFCGVRASRIPWPVLAASRSAKTSTDLRGGEGRQGHLASSQRLRLLVRCVVCTPLCRSAASRWQLLQDPAAKLPPNRRPVWLPLHCGSPGGEPSLRSAAAKPPEEGTTPREFPLISDICFLALLLIN
jgi:hypothetical protein